MAHQGSKSPLRDEKDREKPRTPLPSSSSLSLHDVVYRAHHGVYEEEQILGQDFIVDVDAWMEERSSSSSSSEGETDTWTVAEGLSRVVSSIMEGPPRKLLESVACMVCSLAFQEIPSLRKIHVRLRKPQVRVPYIVDYLGVEVTRERDSQCDEEDKVLVGGLVCFGHHGASKAERDLGQRFRADVSAWFPMSASGASDVLEETVSYVDMARIAQTCIGDKSCTRDSLDEVAADIIKEIFQL